MSAATQRFAYHRSVAPMVWMFFAIATVELIGVHILLAIWWPSIAVAISLVSLAGIVWILHAIRSFRRLPVLLDAEVLAMRCGKLWSLTIARGHYVMLPRHLGRPQDDGSLHH